MSIRTDELGTLALIFVMALTTMTTRLGGIYIMSLVPLGPRVRAFIGAMSTSVLVALLAPLAMQGDSGARIALATTAAIVLTVNKPLPAIAGGILAAALLRGL